MTNLFGVVENYKEKVFTLIAKISLNVVVSWKNILKFSLSENLLYSTKYINLKSTTVYVPSSELGLSHPLSRQRVVSLPPGHTRVGTQSGEEGGKFLVQMISTCLRYT